jgi:hypothetical protein
LVSRRQILEREYRNDEDFYTLLALCGMLLVILRFILLVIAIFRGLRKIDRLAVDDFEALFRAEFRGSRRQIKHTAPDPQWVLTAGTALPRRPGPGLRPGRLNTESPL